MDKNNWNANDYNTFGPIDTLPQTNLNCNSMDPNMLGPLLHGLADLMRAYTEGCRQMFDMGHKLGVEMAQNGCRELIHGDFDPLVMEDLVREQPSMELSEEL